MGKATGMATYTLPELPYDYSSLEPVISGEIIELHHDKHHAGYVKGANDTLEQLAEAREKEQWGNITGLEKNLAAARLLKAGESNEKGKTGLRAGSDMPEPEGSNLFPFFTSSISVGLVPPSLTSFTRCLTTTSCRHCIFIPTLSFSCRSSPTTTRRTLV